MAGKAILSAQSRSSGRSRGVEAPCAAVAQATGLDAESLEKMKFAMKEPEVAPRDIEIDISQDLGGSGGKIVSSHERTEITKLAEARDLNEGASGKERIGAGLSLLPELGVAFEFWGIGGNLSFGGSALSRAMSFFSPWLGQSQ